MSDLQRGESQKESSATWCRERLIQQGGKINPPRTARTCNLSTQEGERLDMPSFGTSNSLAQQHGSNTKQTCPVVLHRRARLQANTSTGAHRHVTPLPSRDQDTGTAARYRQHAENNSPIATPAPCTKSCPWLGRVPDCRRSQPSPPRAATSITPRQHSFESSPTRGKSRNGSQ